MPAAVYWMVVTVVDHIPDREQAELARNPTHPRSHTHFLCVQDLANKHAPELGMQTVPSLNIAYTKEAGYVTADIAERDNLTKLNLSGERRGSGPWCLSVVCGWSWG